MPVLKVFNNRRYMYSICFMKHLMKYRDKIGQFRGFQKKKLKNNI